MPETRFKLSRIRLCLVAIMAVGALTLPSAPAGGSFPGQNGKIVWFTAAGTADADIFEMQPGGANQQRLLDNAAFDGDPQVSPNGKRIVYQSGGQLWVVKANGNDPTLLSPNQAEDPAWVGNKRVVFMRLGELLIMNASGAGTPRFVLRDETVHNEEEPDWSPVTKRIAFVREFSQTNQTDIYTVNVDGTKMKRLTNTVNIREDDPDWSPKTKRLAFTSTADGGDNDVFTMTAGGQDKKNISDNDLHDDEEASWSPSGMLFVYERHTEGEPDDDIWRMKSNGDSQTPLTVNDYDDDNPDWQAL